MNTDAGQAESAGDMAKRERLAEVARVLKRDRIDSDDEMNWMLCPLPVAGIAYAIDYLQQTVPRRLLFRVFIIHKRKGANWRSAQHFGFGMYARGRLQDGGFGSFEHFDSCWAVLIEAAARRAVENYRASKREGPDSSSSAATKPVLNGTSSTVETGHAKIIPPDANPYNVDKRYAEAQRIMWEQQRKANAFTLQSGWWYVLQVWIPAAPGRPEIMPVRVSVNCRPPEEEGLLQISFLRASRPKELRLDKVILKVLHRGFEVLVALKHAPYKDAPLYVFAPLTKEWVDQNWPGWMHWGETETACQTFDRFYNLPRGKRRKDSSEQEAKQSLPRRPAANR